MLPAIAREQPGSWLLAAFIATMATIEHLLMLQALRRAPLSVLTPFGYVQLVFAALFSWLLFSASAGLLTFKLFLPGYF